jgi:uncharacterized protein (DUF433 family)
MRAAELLTPAEAAVVAGVEIRDVNRVIDERILPDDLYRVEDGRWLQANACALVSFYFHTAEKLTSRERSNVIASALKLLKASRYYAGTYKDEFLTIDLSRFADAAEHRHRELKAAREAIEERPDVLGGVPVFKGTRIPVRDVAASLKKGIAKSRILAAYPSLNERLLELGAIYADATPARGRPPARIASARRHVRKRGA